MQENITLNQVAQIIIESFIILFMYLHILKKSYYFKKKKLKIVLFILMYSTFVCCTIMTIPKRYNSFFICIFSIIVLSNIFSINFSASCIAFMSCFTFKMFTELLVALVFSMTAKIAVIKIINNSWNDYRLGCISKLIQVIVICSLYAFKKEIPKIPNSRKEKSTTAYWVLGIVLVGLTIFNNSMKVFQTKDVFLYEFLMFTMLTFFIILGAMDYKEKIEIINLKSKFQLREDYINNLEAVIDIIRREKHDFSNHINTIYAMCFFDKDDTVDKIKDYLNKTTYNLKNAYKFHNTGNVYVDGLIAVKSNFAFENNIILDIDFEALLDAACVNDNDLVAILGNLIDNAFTAVLNSTKCVEKKIVSIYGCIENNKYCLAISNNGMMVPKEIQSKIFEKGFSTKVKNKGNHGFGLYIVRKLVMNNYGKITFNTTPEETEFLLQFNVKKDVE